MNHKQLVRELAQKYPGKKVILNNEVEPTEIVCEIEPTDAHEAWSEAIAVIDSSIPHIHYKTVEEYEVLEGELTIFLDGEKHVLKKGEVLIINPGIQHHAVGHETWIKVTARPGWKIEDHVII